MSRRKIQFSFLICLTYLGGLFLLVKHEKALEKKRISTTLVEKVSSGATGIKRLEKEIKKEGSIGKLQIPKINLTKSLYPIEDERNNVEENVTILKESTYPDQNQSKLFLAAHSGSGHIAFFEELDALAIGDTFSVFYQQKLYTYKITGIETQEKTGKISVPVQQEKQAILTTCHPTKDNKQLVLYATLIKETGSTT